ncbi:putative ABC transporter G family member 14 [Glarea lozoyensis 74030]|uniref:Putative ABC transporter G family member 14 n=1 Tax=Glarea lozoyensis (strain ATCC 74030 / MF5533) TaxID=1104152 RepID=H0EP43_GLAL7|nr:putative ABC transporter G family member 14 [Glarea lozoyensis 74030]
MVKSGHNMEQWRQMPEVKAIKGEDGRGNGPDKMRKLGLTWNNLTVKGVAADASFNESIVSQFLPERLKSTNGGIKASLRTIVDRTHGCVKPGEMLLVLGRPGAGCTSLLKVLANRRHGFSEIDGDVKFGSLDHKEAAKYRGQIVMNTEEEIFYPTLTVGQTIDFVTRMKMPRNTVQGYNNSEEARVASRDFLLNLLGISHTSDTKVGNEYVRGVSGGERKRVSIIEAMATRGSIYCWDNPTRGLDASTALQYIKSIRAMTDIFGLASVVTIYQAGNGIYELFDKVLVLDEGSEIFYGPLKQARPFMEDLGFVCDDGANVADFLTGVTVPTERKIRPGYEMSFPRTAEAIKNQYLQSSIKSEMEAEYGYASTQAAKDNTQEFALAVRDEKHSSKFMKNQPYVVNFSTQLKTATQRQYSIIRGDMSTLIIKQASNIVQALTSGSLFYMAPDNSLGLFIKSGALFVSLLFNSLLAQSEVTDSFAGRPILAKHKSFALHHPAAFCLAQIITDIPILIFQISAFSLILYFMVDLTRTADAFFTFWIYWIDPIVYAFDALLSNEMNNKVLPCVGPNLVPNGPGYASAVNQACTGVRGALPGATSVTGTQYLSSLSYSHSNMWRNVGILWVWWLFYVTLTIVFTSRWKEDASQSGLLLVPRAISKKSSPKIPLDEEAQASEKQIVSSGSSSDQSQDQDHQLIRNTSIFTWKNLTYTVKTPSGPRVLLNNVHGWIKPGMLGALMGSSGAGKTTLLDVLAQRKTDGTIKGSVLVDGRPLSLDIHEPLATVREALEFSALLRQPRTTPREEKLKYVDTIIKLLEMQDIENCLIGTSSGAGLSVEQRKRLTIGVELVSKPTILLFLDEPTSGLDGQAAFNIIRFLKKLASAGQAILVTIHQPSAQLFSQFDTLLLLAKGGNTVYFGDIGDGASTVKDYFEHEASSAPPKTGDDGFEFAMPLWDQVKIVTHRMNISIWRNTEYVNNKFALHILIGLIVGFSFWKLGNSVGELQLRLFAMFNFIFVAPGVICTSLPFPRTTLPTN